MEISMMRTINVDTNPKVKDILNLADGGYDNS